MVESPENLTMIEHEESGLLEVSLHLNLPVIVTQPCDSNSSRDSFQPQQALVQEKRQFAVVLMQTILESFYSVVRAKCLLLQCKRFLQWKSNAFRQCSRVHLLLRGLLHKQRRHQCITLHDAFFAWQISTQMAKIVAETHERLVQRRRRHTAKLAELQKQRLYLANKIQELEAASRPRHRTASQSKVAAALAEHQQLKQGLAQKEQQILNFFEEMGSMLRRARQN